jgi:hypothetical protein
MSQVRNNFVCERENTYVAAERQTHYVRNTLLAILALPTFGLSLLLWHKATPWFCSSCGGPVRDLEEEELAAQRAYLWSKIPLWVKITAIPAFFMLASLIGNIN